MVFDNVEHVLVENRLGQDGEGFKKVAMQVLDRGRLHISAVCVGVAERLIKDCVAYAAGSSGGNSSLHNLPADPGNDRRLQDREAAAKALTMETARQRGAERASTMRGYGRPVLRLRDGWARG